MHTNTLKHKADTRSLDYRFLISKQKAAVGQQVYVELATENKNNKATTVDADDDVDDYDDKSSS